MNLLKTIKKIIPFGIKQRIGFFIYKEYKLKGLEPETVFTEIFCNNNWGDVDSVSGTGSSIFQTENLRKEITNLFINLKVHTVLDIPCGDFYWMRTLDLSNINYIGADIVKEIIQQNNEKYKKENIIFRHLNLIKDDLPKADIIICRDCLVHFSFNDVFSALRNICRNESTYFLSTTFSKHKRNSNIYTGSWRPINLVAQPFGLPDPVLLIKEGCTDDGAADKSLALWKIKDIAMCLKHKQ